MVFRLALSVFGVLLIIFGLIIFALPVPFGALLILAGCALLVSVNEVASAYFRKLRGGYPWFNRFVGGMEVYFPGALGRALRRTAP